MMLVKRNKIIQIITLILLFSFNCLTGQKQNSFKTDLADVVRFSDNPICDSFIHENRKGKYTNMGFVVYNRIGAKFCKGEGITNDRNIEELEKLIKEQYPRNPQPIVEEKKVIITNEDFMVKKELPFTEDFMEKCPPSRCEVFAIIKAKNNRRKPKEEFKVGGFLGFGGLFWDSRPQDLSPSTRLTWFKAYGYCKSKNKRLPTRKEFIENMEDIILELSNDDEEEVMKKVNDPQFRCTTEAQSYCKEAKLYAFQNPFAKFWTADEDESNKKKAWVINLHGYNSDKNNRNREDIEKLFLIEKDFDLGDKGGYVICVSEKEGGIK